MCVFDCRVEDMEQSDLQKTRQHRIVVSFDLRRVKHRIKRNKVKMFVKYFKSK